MHTWALVPHTSALSLIGPQRSLLSRVIVGTHSQSSKVLRKPWALETMSKDVILETAPNPNGMSLVIKGRRSQISRAPRGKELEGSEMAVFALSLRSLLSVCMGLNILLLLGYRSYWIKVHPNDSVLI